MAGWNADRRLVLSPDSSRILGPEEEQTGYLFAPEGREVSEADCKKYNLGPYAPKPVLDQPQTAEGPSGPPEEPALPVAEGSAASVDEPVARGVGVKTPQGATSVRGRTRRR